MSNPVVQSTSNAVYNGFGPHEIPLMEITFPNPVTEGNLLILVITDLGGEEDQISLNEVFAGEDEVATGVYDSQGNTWQLAVEANPSNTNTNGAHAAAIFITKASASGALSIYNGDARYFLPTMTVYEVQGSYDTLDIAAVTANNPGGPYQTGTSWSAYPAPGVPAYENEFCLAVFQAPIQTQPGMTWTPMDGVVATETAVTADGGVYDNDLSVFSEAYVTSDGLWNEGGLSATGILSNGSPATEYDYYVQPALLVTFYNSSDPGPTNPAITTTSLPAATVGEEYSATVAETGGTPPITWSQILGGPWAALPAGLSLNTATGVISGTPEEGEAGTYELLFNVTDSASPQTASYHRVLFLTVDPMTITTTSPLPNAVIGQPYSQMLQVSGGFAPYTWNITGGSLPNGLTLSSAGVISGTPGPTSGGNYSITVEVVDSASPADTASVTLALDCIALAGGYWAHFDQYNRPRPIYNPKRWRS